MCAGNICKRVFNILLLSSLLCINLSAMMRSEDEERELLNHQSNYNSLKKSLRNVEYHSYKPAVVGVHVLSRRRFSFRNNIARKEVAIPLCIAICIVIFVFGGVGVLSVGAINGLSQKLV
jgi:hypothetical protein